MECAFPCERIEGEEGVGSGEEDGEVEEQRVELR